MNNIIDRKLAESMLDSDEIFDLLEVNKVSYENLLEKMATSISHAVMTSVQFSASSYGTFTDDEGFYDRANDDSVTWWSLGLPNRIYNLNDGHILLKKGEMNIVFFSDESRAPIINNDGTISVFLNIGSCYVYYERIENSKKSSVELSGEDNTPTEELFLQGVWDDRNSRRYVSFFIQNNTSMKNSEVSAHPSDGDEETIELKIFADAGAYNGTLSNVHDVRSVISNYVTSNMKSMFFNLDDYINFYANQAMKD